MATPIGRPVIPTYTAAIPPQARLAQPTSSEPSIQTPSKPVQTQTSFVAARQSVVGKTTETVNPSQSGQQVKLGIEQANGGQLLEQGQSLMESPVIKQEFAHGSSTLPKLPPPPKVAAVARGNQTSGLLNEIRGFNKDSLKKVSQHAVLNLGDVSTGSITKESAVSRKTGSQVGGVSLDKVGLPDAEGTIDIVGHSSDGGMKIEGKSPQQLAEHLKNQYGLQKIKTINLVSCESEPFKAEFKQALADLGVEIGHVEGAKGRVAVDRATGKLLDEAQVGNLNKIVGHDGALGIDEALIDFGTSLLRNTSTRPSTPQDQENLAILKHAADQQRAFGNLDSPRTYPQLRQIIDQIQRNLPPLAIAPIDEEWSFDRVSSELDVVVRDVNQGNCHPDICLIRVNYISEKLAQAGGLREIQNRIDSTRRDIDDIKGMQGFYDSPPIQANIYDSDDDTGIENSSDVRVSIGRDPLPATMTTIKTVRDQSNIKGNEMLSIANEVVQNFVGTALDRGPLRDGHIIAGSDFLKTATQMTRYKTALDTETARGSIPQRDFFVGRDRIPMRFDADSDRLFDVRGVDQSYGKILENIQPLIREQGEQGYAKHLLDRYQDGNYKEPQSAFVNALLFGLEGSRNHMSYATGLMTLELIANGRMTFQEAFQDPSLNGLGGQYPMASNDSGKYNLSRRGGEISIARGQQWEQRISRGMKQERSGDHITVELRGQNRDVPVNQHAAVQLKEAALIKNWLMMKGVIGGNLQEHDNLVHDIKINIKNLLMEYNYPAEFYA